MRIAESTAGTTRRDELLRAADGRGAGQAACRLAVEDAGATVAWTELADGTAASVWPLAARSGDGHGTRPGDGAVLDVPLEHGAPTVLRAVPRAPEGFDAGQRAQLTAIAADLDAAFDRITLRARLRATQERSDRLWEVGTEGKFRTTLEGRLVAVNPALATLLGHDSPAAMLAAVDNVRELYDDAVEREGLLADLERAGEVVDRELVLCRRDGARVWVSLTGRLVRDEHGVATGVEGIIVDITERMEAATELTVAWQEMARREAMLEAVTRNAQLLLGPGRWQDAVPKVLAGVATAATASRVSLFINRRENGRLVAARHHVWIAPGAVDPLADHPVMGHLDYEEVGLGEWMPVLADDRCKHGLLTDFEGPPRAFLEALDVHSLAAAPVIVDGEWWGALVFDVLGEARPWSAAEVDVLHTTARMLGTKIERDQAQEVRSRLVAVVETSTDAIITRSPDGEIVTWNTGAEQVYGYAAADAIGRHISLLVPPDHAEDLDNVMGAAVAGATVTGYETQRVRADGTRIHASITAAPVRDENGAVAAVATIERDVTTEVEARLELARSNAELEQFAYVASHDLQEPLRMVTSFVQLLERRYRDELDDTAHEYIGFAVDGATRMQRLINDLLVFSRVATHRRAFAPVDLGVLVGEVVDDLHSPIEEAGAEVEVGPLPTVMGDEGQLRQTLQNLLANAVKFRDVDHAPVVRVTAERQPEGLWRISVADDGIGIDPAHAERVFLIFKRLHTREEFPGTGLGLAISRKIVERHGGTLWFDSEPGLGTTFNLTLPAIAQEA